MKILIVTIYLVVLLGEGKNKFYKIKIYTIKKRKICLKLPSSIHALVFLKIICAILIIFF